MSVSYSGNLLIVGGFLQVLNTKDIVSMTLEDKDTHGKVTQYKFKVLTKYDSFYIKFAEEELFLLMDKLDKFANLDNDKRITDKKIRDISVS